MSIRAQKGFTIPELLVAVAIGAMASILITTAFVYTYGSVVVEQTRSHMVRQSQLFLRRMSDDVRVANQVRTSNLLLDTNGDTWTTSDPANILIVTQPATDSSKNFVYDDITGYPHQHEVVYFGRQGTMYRRLITNTAATGAIQVDTCPEGTSGCAPDIALVDNLDNMLFEFYDGNNTVTAVPEEARSVEITINLKRQLYGQEITTTNKTRVTLRNEN